MSRFLIKQKVFSWTDTYNVFDGNGNPVFFVKADLFSIGHRIRVFNARNNQELGVIQEKVFRIFQEFEISIGGQSYGRIKRKFSLFTPQFDIDYRGWSLSGDFLQWNYDAYEGGYQVMHISKELFHWGDTYVVDIMRPQDDLVGVMLAIALDATKCSADQNNRNSML